MRRFLLTGAMISALLTAATPAAGQLAPGYSGTSSAPIEGVEGDYWILLRTVGSCVADSKYNQSVAFLAAEPGSEAEARAFRQLFGRNSNVCLRNFVWATFQRAHMRGAVAEGLYKRLVRERGEVVPAGMPLTDEQPLRTLHDFARCYVGHHRAEAHAFLMGTRLGTDEEHDAVINMAPEFGKCFPAGRQIRIDAREVRMALAEALYQSIAAERQR
jgi:hypothetical protein